MIEVIPNWHPLLVHFPVALVAVSAIFHVAARLLKGQLRCASHCAVIAHATLWLGAFSAVPAAVLGWLAFNSINHDEAGHAAMLLHRAWALLTLLLLSALAAWDAWRNKVDALPGWSMTGAVIVICGLVFITAWHGGELVYRHGLGVNVAPTAVVGDAHGHDHEDAPHTH